MRWFCFILVLVDHSDIQRRFRDLVALSEPADAASIVAASESKAIGYGSISVVARATGVSRRAITEGMKELKKPRTSKVRFEEKLESGAEGAGRKRTVDKDSSLTRIWIGLVDPVTAGDPESPLRWMMQE